MHPQGDAATTGEFPETSPAIGAPFRYDAFLSYRRLRATPLPAGWLALEHYRLPKHVLDKLRGEARRAGGAQAADLSRFVLRAGERRFLDREDCAGARGCPASGRDLDPDAFEARSDGSENWLCREVDTYLGLQDRDPEPTGAAGALAPGAQEDQFPGRLSERRDWDWVDFRHFSWRRFLPFGARAQLDDAFTKLVAALYELPDEHLPALRNEERRRRKRVIGLTVAGAVALAAAMAGLTVCRVRPPTLGGSLPKQMR